MKNSMEFKQLKCDSCDYIEETENITIETCSKYLNKPCPKCGANLFTEKDYATLKIISKILKVESFLAKILNFFHIQPKGQRYSVSMKGNGSVKFKEID
jgi:predicted nucleic-acid-binding Zn-ribbon protein